MSLAYVWAALCPFSNLNNTCNFWHKYLYKRYSVHKMYITCIFIGSNTFRWRQHWSPCELDLRLVPPIVHTYCFTYTSCSSLVLLFSDFGFHKCHWSFRTLPVFWWYRCSGGSGNSASYLGLYMNNPYKTRFFWGGDMPFLILQDFFYGLYFLDDKVPSPLPANLHTDIVLVFLYSGHQGMFIHQSIDRLWENKVSRRVGMDMYMWQRLV